MGVELIDAKAIRSWVEKDARAYAGVYHFGLSEAESDFVLCVEPGLITAQITGGQWSEDGKQWLSSVQNLRNVRIVGNKLTADQLSGDFVRFRATDGAVRTGLRVRQPWSPSTEKGAVEVGPWSAALATHFDMDFGVASFRLLTPADLQGLSKLELTLMRNGVFARYGLRFAPGGAMDQHFRRQDWYTPQHHDVAAFLTEIERRNVALIRQREAAL
ncbi:YARHG domain-containing protein [Hymenobacter coalescens]